MPGNISVGDTHKLRARQRLGNQASVQLPDPARPDGTNM
jgi:hypothetical protein